DGELEGSGERPGRSAVYDDPGVTSGGLDPYGIALQRQWKAFERPVAGAVEEDGPSLPQIARAYGDYGGRIEIREHDLSINAHSPDQGAILHQRQHQAGTRVVARRPVDGHRVRRFHDANIARKSSARLAYDASGGLCMGDINRREQRPA